MNADICLECNSFSYCKLASWTGFATQSLMFAKLLKHANVSIGVANPDRHRTYTKL